MARSNRPRRRGTGRKEYVELDVEKLTAGWRRTEFRHGHEWNVQPVSAQQAIKSYSCPGCQSVIDAGVPHVVAWRADGVLGDAADVAGRRHWHSHCWRLS